MHNPDDEESIYSLPLKILIDFYISILSDFIAIIPYFIMKRLVKKKEGDITNVKIEDTNKHTSSFDSNLIYNNYEESISKKRYFILY